MTPSGMCTLTGSFARWGQPSRCIMGMQASLIFAVSALFLRPVLAGERQDDVRELFKQAGEAIRTDEYMRAAELASQAYRLSQQRKVTAPFLLAKAIAAKAITLRRAYAATLDARRRLTQDPNDPLAKKVMGSFYAFTKGDPNRGLPLLKEGDDPKLREAAARDLSQPEQPAQQLALADSWWALSSKAAGLSQQGMRSRAAVWYRAAYSQLQGEDKARAGKRIVSLLKLGRDRTLRPDPASLHGKLTWKELDIALGVRLSGLGPPKALTGFYLTSTADNQSQEGVVQGVMRVEGRILCKDGNGHLNVIHCTRKDLPLNRRGEQDGGLWGNCKTGTVTKRNAGSKKPIDYHVAVLIGDVIIYEGFLTGEIREPWWLDDSLLKE